MKYRNKMLISILLKIVPNLTCENICDLHNALRAGIRMEKKDLMDNNRHEVTIEQTLFAIRNRG